MDVIGFGILLGCALGMRVLGLLMVGYAGLALLMHVTLHMQDEPLRERLAFLRTLGHRHFSSLSARLSDHDHGVAVGGTVAA